MNLDDAIASHPEGIDAYILGATDSIANGMTTNPTAVAGRNLDRITLRPAGHNASS